MGWRMDHLPKSHMLSAITMRNGTGGDPTTYADACTLRTRTAKSATNDRRGVRMRKMMKENHG